MTGVTRFATRGDHRLSYESHGDANGTPVLVLHDLLADRAQTRPLAGRLAGDGFRATLPDARGHGASPLIAGRSYSAAELAADALAVATAEGVAMTHIVALGWAAAAALEMAVSAPERILSLVLAGPYLPGLLADRAVSDIRNHVAIVRDASSAAEKGQTDLALDRYLGQRIGAGWQAELPKPRLGAIRRAAASLGPLLAGAAEPADRAGLRSITVPVAILLREDASAVEHASADELATVLARARITPVTGETEICSVWADAIATALRSGGPIVSP
jgi:pimeloyl-ACP methyl ester carboxylesterase